MSVEDEKTFQVREMRGVNQSEDARISEPGLFWATKNYYARRKGVLSPRPGSQLVSQSFILNPGRTVSSLGTTMLGGMSITPVANTGAVGSTNYWPNILDTQIQQNIIRPNDAAMVAGNHPKSKKPLIMHVDQNMPNKLGPSGNDPNTGLNVNPNGKVITDQNLPTGTTTPQTPTTYTGAQRVAGIWRLYCDDGPNRFLMCAVNHEPPLGDKICYLTSAGNLQTLPVTTGLITTAGAEWYYIPYHYTGDPGNGIAANGYTGGFYGILTNGVDAPLTICCSTQMSKPTTPGFSSPLGEFSTVNIDLTALQITSTETVLAGYQAVAVNSMCMYGGSLVLGGYKMWKDGSLRDFTNSIVFCDPGKPQSMTSDTASTYNIIVGDGRDEPVTCVVPSSVQTDAMGLSSQLLVFTAKKIRSYSGFPPVSGSQAPTNFAALGSGDVGCVAPRTVCRTPHGIIFLGTDGYVYLIPPDGTPRVISYALENTFFGMTPNRQLGACAVYRLGWYMLSFASGNGTASWRPSPMGVTSNATSQTHKNDQQMWCDVRNLGRGTAETDYGAKWWGPQTNLFASCFSLASGPEDFNDLYIGWDHSATISQMMITNQTTDPSQADPGTTMVYDNQMILGEFDMGNPHIEKTVTAVSVGTMTNAPAIVTMNLQSYSDSGSQGRGAQQQFLVQPSGTTWNGSTWNNGYWTGDMSFAQQAERPPFTVRGRAFGVEFRASAPFVVGTTNNKIDFVNVTPNSTNVATIASGTYTGTTLATAVQTAMNAASVGVWTVTFSIATGTFTFTFVSGALTSQILWLTGVNNANGAYGLLGFSKLDGAVMSPTNTATSNTTPIPTTATPQVSFADIEVRYRPIPRLP